MRYLACILLLLTLTSLSCKVSPDDEIVRKLFSHELTDLRYYIGLNANSNNRYKEHLPLLDTILSQIENKSRLSNDVKREMLDHVLSWQNDKHHERLPSYSYLIENATRFEYDDMIWVEELDYSRAFFLCIYWAYWSCNYDVHKVAYLYHLDTLLLEEQRSYDLPVQIQYFGLPSLKIISNSKQGSRSDRVEFTTGSLSFEVQKIPLELKAFNEATGEFSTYRDTIRYKVVGKKNKRS